jgi:conjugative relaxase-like TrwC/TraI family protein
MLTISKLRRWSINYYLDTAATAERASKDRHAAGGGLGEYYSEHETRTPVWLCAGDTHTAARLVRLSDVERAGGVADAAMVAAWLDDGVAPNGLRGRGFGPRSVHGFDLTFCAPKSVSLVRALSTNPVLAKAIADAHATAMGEAMEYLGAHAGFTRVHNPVTGEKDLVHLPGLVAVAYQHETSRCGDPHLHTHVIVPNRQARADGSLVSIDGTSLFHEARAAGMIYQATLRRELHQSMGFEWAPVDESTGMADIAGIDRDTITAWSRRSSQLREWAAHNLTLVEGDTATAAQLAAAQKATRPTKPEELAWGDLVEQWRADTRGLAVDRGAHFAARAVRVRAARTGFDRARLADVAARIDKSAFTRADLVEVIAAQVPVDSEASPRELVERAVDELGVRLTAPRAPHQRERHERFTLDQILAEETAVLDLAGARNDRTMLHLTEDDTAHLSAQQARAVRTLAQSPWLVQVLSAPAGAGKTTALRALASAVNRYGDHLVVLAPTGKAVDVALREIGGGRGFTIAKAVQSLRDGTLEFKRPGVVVVDEAGMVGTDDLRQLLTATTEAGVKTVLVGDAHQLAPVKARGGMFAQLAADLPWAQNLSEVWRMRDPAERTASLALRDGGPEPVRNTVDWYRDHDRLHCGDQVTMAADALAAYQTDTAAGRHALLVCDTREVADALNQRLHAEHADPDTESVTGAGGQRIAVGDIILTRRNDPTIALDPSTPDVDRKDSVRNGQRWRVAGLNADTGRLAAVRLDDDARVIFDAPYRNEHVTLGYAVTVHSAQGVTADTTHAVLGDSATRSLFYAAMTRGRQANNAYLYERTPEPETAQTAPTGVHVPVRGTGLDAADLTRAILAHDDPPVTAHQYAARTPSRLLPNLVERPINRHNAATQPGAPPTTPGGPP